MDGERLSVRDARCVFVMAILFFSHIPRRESTQRLQHATTSDRQARRSSLYRTGARDGSTLYSYTTDAAACRVQVQVHGPGPGPEVHRTQVDKLLGYNR